MHLVVVESPAKAKTIESYLGSEYKVIASLGHIRDLPSSEGSVKPDNNFEMIWELGDKGKKQAKTLNEAVKNSESLILATDPDREGEAIAWHVLEVLQEKGSLKDKKVSRVTFNAITKKEITEAINKPREIDNEMVEAYLARRALDYLVGFTISQFCGENYLALDLQEEFNLLLLDLYAKGKLKLNHLYLKNIGQLRDYFHMKILILLKQN